MGQLTGQVAVITGATAGIGKAIALRFAKEGAYVVAVGTNGERGAQVVQEMGEGKGEFIPFNVSETAAVDAGFKQILEKHKHIDILINNAGITRDGLLMKMGEADWDELMAINLKSCYNTCRAAVRAMMKARKGKIINMSSVVGLTGNAGQANYAASKAGMIGFSKALAKELAPRNICVNCIAPGFIETAMTDALTEEQKKLIDAAIPLSRMGTVEEIAEAALYLATANYVTGQVLTVDGGMAI